MGLALKKKEDAPKQEESKASLEENVFHKMVGFNPNQHADKYDQLPTYDPP